MPLWQPLNSNGIRWLLPLWDPGVSDRTGEVCSEGEGYCVYRKAFHSHGMVIKLCHSLKIGQHKGLAFLY